MKKQIRNFTMLLLVATTWTGCTDEAIVENPTTNTSKGTTLIASTGDNSPQTRIDFTDNGTSGIDLKWSAGDEFTIINKSSEKIVGNFVLKSGAGSAQGVFEAVGNVSLTNGTEYIAVYPAISTAVTASYSYLEHPTAGYIASGNNDMTQLNDMLYMEAKFKYSGTEVGTQIAFKHQYAMLTIKLPTNATTDAPAKVSMHSSTNDFSDVQFINIDPTSEITAYTMMKPATGDRNLTFAVTTTTGKVYTQTINTSKEYAVGKRYTATLDALTELTIGTDLASFANSAPTGDIWIITDGGSPTTAEFGSLRTQLDAIKDSGRKIELIFPNIVEIPAFAMYDSNTNTNVTALASVNCPKATAAGNYAFYKVTNLSSIYFPQIATIGTNLFSNTGLSSIYLPELATVPNSTFYNCPLTTAYLPKVTSIARYAFSYCKYLKSLTVATEANLTSLEADIFSQLSTLTNITLTTNSGTAADNSWTAGGQTYGPFKKVISIP